LAFLHEMLMFSTNPSGRVLVSEVRYQARLVPAEEPSSSSSESSSLGVGEGPSLVMSYLPTLGTGSRWICTILYEGRRAAGWGERSRCVAVVVEAPAQVANLFRRQCEPLRERTGDKDLQPEPAQRAILVQGLHARTNGRGAGGGSPKPLSSHRVAKVSSWAHRMGVERR